MCTENQLWIEKKNGAFELLNGTRICSSTVHYWNGFITFTFSLHPLSDYYSVVPGAQAGPK